LKKKTVRKDYTEEELKREEILDEEVVEMKEQENKEIEIIEVENSNSDDNIRIITPEKSLPEKVKQIVLQDRNRPVGYTKNKVLASSSKLAANCKYGFRIGVRERGEELEVEFFDINLQHTGHDKNFGVSLSGKTKSDIKHLAAEVGLDSKGIQSWLRYFENKEVPKSLITSLANEKYKGRSDIDVFTDALTKSPNYRFIVRMEGPRTKESSYKIKFGPSADHIVKLRNLNWRGHECLSKQMEIGRFSSPSNQIILKEPGEVSIGAEIVFCSTKEMEMGLKYNEAFCIDPTENTNRTKSSFAKLIGVDGFGRSYSALSCFIISENIDSMELFLKCVELVYGTTFLSAIHCFATDGGKGIPALLKMYQEQGLIHPDCVFLRDIFHVVFMPLQTYGGFKKDGGVTEILNQWVHSLAYKIEAEEDFDKSVKKLFEYLEDQANENKEFQGYHISAKSYVNTILQTKQLWARCFRSPTVFHVGLIGMQNIFCVLKSKNRFIVFKLYCCIYNQVQQEEKLKIT